MDLVGVLWKPHRRSLPQTGSLAKGEEEIRGLRQKVQAGEISKEDALARMRAHRDKMDAALLKADPSVGPIIEKMKASVKERVGRQGKAGKAATP
jgi:hypothetical protein